MEKKCCGTRICSPALGLGFGIATGLLMMFFAWTGWLWNVGVDTINQYASIYFGYAPTFMGGVFGFIWGLVEGFIFGLITGLVYNCCSRCCSCSKTCPVCQCNDKKSPMP